MEYGPCRNGPGGWDARVAYLAGALRWLPPADAQRAARQLERADAAVRAALGIGPDRRLLPGDPPCPACGRTTLRAEVSSLDERDWTISCAPDCRCTGVQCACHRPNRTPDDPHLWPVEEYAATFGELRGYLRAMRAVEAGAITRDGVVYATADQLTRVLDGGVTPRILRDWLRHGILNALKIGPDNLHDLSSCARHLVRSVRRQHDKRAKHRRPPRDHPLLRGGCWLTAADMADQVDADISPELLRDRKRRGLSRGAVVGGDRRGPQFVRRGNRAPARRGIVRLPALLYAGIEGQHPTYLRLVVGDLACRKLTGQQREPALAARPTSRRRSDRHWLSAVPRKRAST